LNFAGFTLESSTNLAADSWRAVSVPGPRIIGTNYQLVLPATNTLQFFRLTK
jgi:hypothetical protein